MSHIFLPLACSVIFYCLVTIVDMLLNINSVVCLYRIWVVFWQTIDSQISFWSFRGLCLNVLKADLKGALLLRHGLFGVLVQFLGCSARSWTSDWSELLRLQPCARSGICLVLFKPLLKLFHGPALCCLWISEVCCLVPVVSWLGNTLDPNKQIEFPEAGVLKLWAWPLDQPLPQVLQLQIWSKGTGFPLRGRRQLRIMRKFGHIVWRL